ncbi:unnamed protein product [Protopolystoma xenopodis]|uniref:Uncharacterized protein n=1 Tax=Protopolystoma xenopodis TaxID=117903 RepID=A0A3S4ZNI3_9PLAT|nr:unnamed protein product [Protopolystoma xenopodis]
MMSVQSTDECLAQETATIPEATTSWSSHLQFHQVRRTVGRGLLRTIQQFRTRQSSFGFRRDHITNSFPFEMEISVYVNECWGDFDLLLYIHDDDNWILQSKPTKTESQFSDHTPSSLVTLKSESESRSQSSGHINGTIEQHVDMPRSDSSIANSSLEIGIFSKEDLYANHSVTICNHSYDLDWLSSWTLCERVGRLGVSLPICWHIFLLVLAY